MAWSLDDVGNDSGVRLLRKDRFLAPEETITVRVDMELSSPKQQIMTLRPPEILSATMFFLDKDEEERLRQIPGCRL